MFRTSVAVIGDRIEYLTVQSDGRGQYWISREATPPSDTEVYDSVIAAVNHFIGANPTLAPAIGQPLENSVLKDSDAPPDYSQAERALQVCVFLPWWVWGVVWCGCERGDYVHESNEGSVAAICELLGGKL